MWNIAPFDSSFFSQFLCVGDISVVRNGEVAFCVFYAYRLSVLGSIIAGSRVSYVTDGDLALQMSQIVVVEYLAYKSEIFDQSDLSVLVYCDTRGFLSSVLKSEETEIDLVCDISDIRFVVYSENAALFFDVIRHNRTYLLIYFQNQFYYIKYRLYNQILDTKNLDFSTNFGKSFRAYA